MFHVEHRETTVVSLPFCHSTSHHETTDVPRGTLLKYAPVQHRNPVMITPCSTWNIAHLSRFREP